jgi:hypothetical protein
MIATSGRAAGAVQWPGGPLRPCNFQQKPSRGGISLEPRKGSGAKYVQQSSEVANIKTKYIQCGALPLRIHSMGSKLKNLIHGKLDPPNAVKGFHSRWGHSQGSGRPDCMAAVAMGGRSSLRASMRVGD